MWLSSSCLLACVLGNVSALCIMFNNGKVIDSGNYRTRKTLESWHTAVITNSDNNSKPLPKQYATLVRKLCNR